MDRASGVTPAGRLLKAGISDVGQALGNLASLERIARASVGEGFDVETAVVAHLSECADPDLALAGLTRIAEQGQPGFDELLEQVSRNETCRRRLFAVLGASQALGDHLRRYPRDADLLAGDLRRIPRQDMIDQVRDAVSEQHSPSASQAAVNLRLAYRRLLLGISAQDLAEAELLDSVAAQLADLADAVLAGALDIAHREVGEPGYRLSVIGMGKCGGRELNYVSDVDVIFVAEPEEGFGEAEAIRIATKVAAAMMRTCSAVTTEGCIWEVDAALRPEGKSGALVRTLASHIGYYERWAKTWEFQALLKARVSAGDAELGARYVDAVLPFVWSAGTREGFVTDVQAMRRRVEAHIPAREADRELKLGRGGIRDIEFAVQLLQLVHGRSDVMVRSPNTLEALESLAVWGYVGRDDAAGLARSYRFLRRLEHMIQLHRLRRTHVLPEGQDDLRRLGRAMGYKIKPAEELEEEWRRQTRYVRRIHEKLFYRPLLGAVASLEPGQIRLTPEAARARLEALGFRDPHGAQRNLDALTHGVSRRAVIQRTLLPVMLGWFADATDPDAGLLNFRKVSENLGGTPWYLRLLRDESVVAERLAKILATSPYATDLLLRAPEAVRLLADEAELRPRERDALLAEAKQLATRHEEAVPAIAAVRGMRRRELFRIASADVLGLLDVEEVASALTDVADATLIAGLDVAMREVGQERRIPTAFQIVGMGRYGGEENGYASDVDVMFVHEPFEGEDDHEAAKAATAIANTLRALLHQPSPDPPVELDADLRPEGKNGALVRSLASYRAYYQRYSSTWEAQALLRAFAVAGDAGLGERFIELINPTRWPEGGLSQTQVLEIRRLKARMEAERLPRGADPTLHLKLGRGGLSDVEWVIQLIQLQNAHRVESLRTTRTLPAIRAAHAEGLLAAEDASILSDAWRLATRIRNAITLTNGKPSDSVPTDVRDLAAVGRLLGYAPGHTGELLDDYRRVTRRARAVMDRLFYGLT